LIGNFTIDSGANLITNGGEIAVKSSWTNAGAITISDGAFFLPDFDPSQSQTITNTGTMLLPAGATFLGWAGSSSLALNNSGTMSVSGHWRDLSSDPRPVANSGQITIGNTGEVDAWNISQSAGKTLVNGLLSYLANGSQNTPGTFSISGGNAGGAGTIQHYNVNLTGGTLLAGDDGAPAGLKFVDSTLTLSGGSTLASEILDGSHFGHFDFSGTGDSVSLGGALDVSLLNGANYSFGQTFTLITADQISGSFDTVNLPDGWHLESTPTSVSVIAVPEPVGIALFCGVFGLLLRPRRRRPSR
jgi:hypothetical protein